MGKVACIYFAQPNIILLKDNLEQTKNKNIFVERQNKLGNLYYNVYINKDYNKITQKLWCKLESLLLDLGVTYIIWASDFESPIFQELEYIDGSLVQRVLSYHILKYIGKYRLIKKEIMYMNIGVVAGRFNETLDVITPLLEDITNLTIITDMPKIYREVAAEIYEIHRLKVKVVHPQKITMQNLDIIYHLDSKDQYSYMCNPHSIYIDLMGYLNKRDFKTVGILPSIWQGFDILCDRYEIPIPLLEAFCYSEGFSRRNLMKKIKDLDISISKVYTLGKLTMSV